MIAVSNTTPLCYLVLIEAIELLPQLFERVVIPSSVRDELMANGAPPPVQDWIKKPPSWLEIQSVNNHDDQMLQKLQTGEKEAILLAEQLGADVIILDEKAARSLSIKRGLQVVGLLGILTEAYRLHLIDLSTALGKLKQTNFRISQKLLESVLSQT